MIFSLQNDIVQDNCYLPRWWISGRVNMWVYLIRGEGNFKADLHNYSFTDLNIWINQSLCSTHTYHPLIQQVILYKHLISIHSIPSCMEQRESSSCRSFSLLSLCGVLLYSVHVGMYRVISRTITQTCSTSDHRDMFKLPNFWLWLLVRPDGEPT